ncbi:MAG: hypothetical protein EXR27_08065 [Betaproteobacteria bacterium]|nr:hypothetical protein [Betaproteobacteria bacterium]
MAGSDPRDESAKFLHDASERRRESTEREHESPARLRQRAAARFDAGDHRGAHADYAALIALDPAPEAFVNRGYCELMLGDAAAAEDSFGAALSLNPAMAEALVGMGDSAAARDMHEQAVRHYDAALAARPEFVQTRNNRAQSRLALGHLRAALEDAECRYDAPGATSLYPHRLALPRWRGEAGKRVLVHWEQGYGDMMQFLRYLPALTRNGIDAVFECPPPLARLVAHMGDTPQCMEARHEAPDTALFDCCVPLLSLPLILGAEWRDVPTPPYVAADTSAAASLAGAWGPPTVRRVGIVWRASSFDAIRSATLQSMLMLAQPGVQLVSLQTDLRDEERSALAAHGIPDAGSGFGDFYDTATALAAVDRLITVDTAIAHLAGAMDKPVWLMLNQPAATRWMTGCEDSPWYPSMRLFRKRNDEAWDALLERISAALVRDAASDNT